MDLDEICKGCKSLETGCFVHSKQNIGYFLEDKVRLKCPCSKCLLKMMCKMTCTTFITFGIETLNIIRDLKIMEVKNRNSNRSIFLEDCRTCFIDHSSKCLLKYDPKLAQKCPCHNCLVKMMCSKFCKERIRLYESSLTSNNYFLIKEGSN